MPDPLGERQLRSGTEGLGGGGVCLKEEGLGGSEQRRSTGQQGWESGFSLECVKVQIGDSQGVKQPATCSGGERADGMMPGDKALHTLELNEWCL